MNQNEPKPRTMILVIASCLLAWGGLLAAGAVMAPSDEGQAGDFRKLGVVAAVVAGFLLLWGGVLLARARKVRRDHPPNDSSR